jgi:hypothetical protein
MHGIQVQKTSDIALDLIRPNRDFELLAIVTRR